MKHLQNCMFKVVDMGFKYALFKTHAYYCDVATLISYI